MAVHGSLLLLLLLLGCVCLQAQQLSTVDQQQLEADQSAAVEREDFETAAALDEQLQVGISNLWLFGLVLLYICLAGTAALSHTQSRGTSCCALLSLAHGSFTWCLCRIHRIPL
jgi:hypothetical protein